MNTYTIRKRNTGEVLDLTFPTKFEAAKYLIFNHGLTWDRRYSIIAA